MYHKIKGGTKVILRGQYECWIPPKPSDSAIAGFNKPRHKQFWTRTPLPDFYEERVLEEQHIREKQQKEVSEGLREKIEYVDQDLQKFRNQEWRRRLNGFWFFVDGVPTWITGTNYYYLNWTRWDHEDNDGYPNYYRYQRERFYFRAYCETDPNCLGYVIIGPRGYGKSTEELAAILERNTRPPRRKAAAIQSKSDDDAKIKLFQEKLVPTFNELPDFFKPMYNHGSNPKERLSFFRDDVRGAAARKVKYGDEEELRNYIYTAPSGEKALDTGSFRDILNDEIGKTLEHIAHVARRAEVNRLCVFRNNRKVGMLRCTSTVEEMDQGGEPCHELWLASDPEKRTANGKTISGLYRYFVPIDETDTQFSDEFGNIGGDIKQNIDGVIVSDKTLDEYHNAEREARKHDSQKWASWVRKHPRYENEIWIKDGAKSTFNSMRLNNYLLMLDQHGSPLFVKGNFNWKNKPFGEVEFHRDDLGGRWEIALIPDADGGGPFAHVGNQKLQNNFRKEYRNGKEVLIPNNSHLFSAGCDPIKDVKTKDPRASKFSGWIFYKYQDTLDKDKPLEDWLSYRFICRYNNRPEEPSQAYEDMAMALLFYGCPINPETNVSGFNTYLKQHGMEPFIIVKGDFNDDIDLGKRTTRMDEALQSTPEVIQAYTDWWRTFINRHFVRLNACPFRPTIVQLQEFDPQNPTIYDDVVGGGFTGLGLSAAIEATPEEIELQEWWPTYDGEGNLIDEEEEFEETY